MAKYVLPANSLGDATPADVLAGRTFTSASGVKQVGTALPDLEDADATEDVVFIGRTFYAGGRNIKAGTYDPDWAIKKSW